MEQKIKVCAYCRVSTNSKDQENSFENQKRYFEREIDKSSDSELVGIYADKGITGTSFSKRQEFNRMLHDAGIDITNFRPNKLDRRSNKVVHIYSISDREPKFKYILTKNTSRFARNIEVVLIIRKLQEKGVFVNFIDIKTSTENDANSILVNILFTMDENESKDKSRKVKFGIIEGANNGMINANSRLYGYKYIQKENRLETIDEEAENIKLIFEMYSTNYGIRRIINYLSEHNINTRSGLDFSKSTISRILQNEKYAGLNARLKYDTGEVLKNKHSPKIKPKGEWIVHKSDKIPAIISIDLFDVCQHIRESKVNTINQKGKYKGISEFAGLIKCSNCGNYYTKNKDRNRIFYNCSKKKAKGIDACNNVNINLDELNEFIEIYRKSKYREAINLYKTSVVKKLKNIKNKLIENFDNDKEQEVMPLKDKLENLENKRVKLLELYLEDESDVDDKSLYDQKLNSIKQDKERLSKKIFELSKDNIEKLKDIKSIDDNIEYIVSLPIKDEYTRDEIMDLINFIEIRPYPYKGNYYSKKLLNYYYHIKRNGIIVGLADISTKIKNNFRNIMMKYKDFPLK